MTTTPPPPDRAEPESVWDYPRPPRVEPCPHRLQIFFNGLEIASSRAAHRVLETSHPPVYYLPPEDVRSGCLEPSERSSWCEFKGRARYHHVVVGERRAEDAAWSYPEPLPGYESIADCLAFYAGAMDRCLVDDEEVEPQPGGFYGGWITSHVRGPFKGGPGSSGW